MKVLRKDFPPLDVADVPDGEGRTQVAALCWRMSRGRPEVLLVTSRETGRWVLPKGWPIKGRDPAEAAAQEAWEEAGATGKIKDGCIGLYAYHKVLGPEKGVPCVVAVYPMKVKALADDYPERHERKRRWFRPKKAADKVDEPELKQLLVGFDPQT